MWQIYKFAHWLFLQRTSSNWRKPPPWRFANSTELKGVILDLKHPVLISSNFCEYSSYFIHFSHNRYPYSHAPRTPVAPTRLRAALGPSSWSLDFILTGHHWFPVCRGLNLGTLYPCDLCTIVPMIFFNPFPPPAEYSVVLSSSVCDVDFKFYLPLVPFSPPACTCRFRVGKQIS